MTPSEKTTAIANCLLDTCPELQLKSREGWEVIIARIYDIINTEA